MFPWACPKFPSGSESKKPSRNESSHRSDNGLSVRSHRSTSTEAGGKARGDDSPARFSHHRGQSHLPLVLCPGYSRSKTRSLERRSDVIDEKIHGAPVGVIETGNRATRRKPQKRRPPSSNRHSIGSSSVDAAFRPFTAEADAAVCYKTQSHGHTDYVGHKVSSKNQINKYSVFSTGYPPFPDPSITPLIEGLPWDCNGQHAGSWKTMTSQSSKSRLRVDETQAAIPRNHDKRSQSSGAMNELHMRRNKNGTSAAKYDMGRSVEQKFTAGETPAKLTALLVTRADKKKETHCPQRHSLSMTATRQPKIEKTKHFEEELMDQIEEIKSAGDSFLNEDDTGYDTPIGKVWSPTKRPGRKKKRFRKNYQGAAMNLTTRHSVGSFANLQQQFTNLPNLIDQLSPFEDVFLEAERASLPNSISIPEACEELFGFSSNNQIVLSFEELALNENTNCFMRHSKSYCSATTEQLYDNVKTHPEVNSDQPSHRDSQNVHTLPLTLQSIIKELPSFLASPTSGKELPCQPLNVQANTRCKKHSDANCCDSAIMESNGLEHSNYNTSTSTNNNIATTGEYESSTSFVATLRRNTSCMSEPDQNVNGSRSRRLYSATEDETFSNMELVKPSVACSDSDVSKSLSSKENNLSMLSASTSALKSSVFGSQKLEETLKSVSEMSLKPRIRLPGVVHSSASSYSYQRQFSPLIVNRILASANALKIDDSVIELSRSRSDGAKCANKLMAATTIDESPQRKLFQRSSVQGIECSLDKVFLSSKAAVITNGTEEIVGRKKGNTSFLFSSASTANCFPATCGTTPTHPRLELITQRSDQGKENLKTKTAVAAAAAVNDNFCSSVKSVGAAAASTTATLAERSYVFIIDQDSTRTKLSEEAILPIGHKRPDKLITAQTDFTPTIFARETINKSFKQRQLSIPTLRKANVALNFTFIPEIQKSPLLQVSHKRMENNTIPVGVAAFPQEHSTETSEGRSDELNPDIQLSCSNDESSSMATGIANANKKKEIAVKPQPPASLIKPLDILEFFSHSVSKNTIPEPHDLNNSVSMPVLPGNISYCVKSMTSSDSMENSNARWKIPNGFQHKSANNLPVKEQYESPAFLQPNPDIKFSVAFSEEHLHVPVQVSCFQNSSENVTTNTSRCESVNELELLDTQDLESSEVIFRGMERSTTFPTTINELLDAETRVTEN